MGPEVYVDCTRLLRDETPFAWVALRDVIANAADLIKTEVGALDDALGRVAREEECAGAFTKLEEEKHLDLRVILHLINIDLVFLHLFECGGAHTFRLHDALDQSYYPVAVVPQSIVFPPLLIVKKDIINVRLLSLWDLASILSKGREVAFREHAARHEGLDRAFDECPYRLPHGQRCDLSLWVVCRVEFLLEFSEHDPSFGMEFPLAWVQGPLDVVHELFVQVEHETLVTGLLGAVDIAQHELPNIVTKTTASSHKQLRKAMLVTENLAIALHSVGDADCLSSARTPKQKNGAFGFYDLLFLVS
mmetsp:Transcript_23363/g.52977  ORF Transcript_23363/g.52977 Transcript_23363/m.52977 type:complete len:305 (+) Transcript_23363:681-1595(+)